MEKLTNTRNVLVTVDVQNDFVTGSLAVNEGDQVVDPINTIAEVVRDADGIVALTRDWHPEHTPHFATDGGVWPVHCVAETDGAAFVPELDIQPTDIILSKGMEQTDGYSGWEGVSENGETLETLIAPQSQKEKVRVFVGGLATDYCVKATGIDIATHFANDPRVTTYLLTDAIRAVALQQADEANALKQIQEAGVIAISSDEARAMIERMI